MGRRGGEITQGEEKVHIQPICYCGIDETKNKLIADLEIPGVDRKDIAIDAFEDGFRLNAPKQDVTYSGIYHIGCTLNTAKTEETYQNGIMYLEIPVLEMPIETKIEIR